MLQRQALTPQLRILKFVRWQGEMIACLLFAFMFMLQCPKYKKGFPDETLVHIS